MKTQTLILALVILTPGFVSAQDVKAYQTLNELVWLETGMGTGAAQAKVPNSSIAGASLLAGMHYVTGSHDFALRGNAVMGFGAGSATELSLLYGRALVRRLAMFNVAAGPGWVHTDESSVDGKERKNMTVDALGVALEGGAMFIPSSLVGIGIKAMGNVNPEAPYVALMVTLNLGRLRFL